MSAHAAGRMLLEFFRPCPQNEMKKIHWEREFEEARTNPAQMQKFLEQGMDDGVESQQPLALRRAADLLWNILREKSPITSCNDIINDIFCTLPVWDPDSERALRGDGILVPGGLVSDLLWVQEGSQARKTFQSLCRSI